MNLKTMALLAVLAVPGAAQTTALDPKAAAAGVQAASEIARTVGREHDTAILYRVKDLVELEHWTMWCLVGPLKTKTARGEAAMLYAELLPDLKEGAQKLKGREALLAQSKALAAIAGGELDELTMRVFEKETARAKADQEWMEARERGLRAMMIRSGWAVALPDGRLRVIVEDGVDLQSTSACGGDGY